MIELNHRTCGTDMVTIALPTSKSVANRELILSYLTGAPKPTLDNDSPDDVVILRDAIYSDHQTWNLGHAGTAMRFATALACIGNKKRILRGSERMHQRPIKILVDALRNLGAEIQYLGRDGFPPLEIDPANRLGGQVAIDGSVSSQYISALLLIAPKMKGGLSLELIPPVTSSPYIELTLKVMRSKGLTCTWEGELIHIPEQVIRPFDRSESRDWSAAAFFYGLVAQGHPMSIYLPGLDLNSAQGDRALMQLYQELGVKTEPYQNGLRLYRTGRRTTLFQADLSGQPDLAQAIAFTCAALGIDCHLTGLHTLRIKETDRISAIRECLVAVGCTVETGGDYIRISGKAESSASTLFQSYEDHRMAMAISILGPALGKIKIANEEVVSKSFPQYWEELQRTQLFDLIKT